jgi:hypothetical protein
MPSPIALEVLTVVPHYVALPYRGDGVARALCETYRTDGDEVPTDMTMLLAAMDNPPSPSGPG